MKKSLLFVMSCIPALAHAQAQTDTSMGWTEIIIAIVVFIILFIVCRELICWYYKINRCINNQERIIELLESINQKLDKRYKEGRELSPAFFMLSRNGNHPSYT